MIEPRIRTDEHAMRTNKDIYDTLISDAIRAAGVTTKKAAVEQGLRLLIRLAEQKRAIEDMRGMGLEGDLDPGRERRDL